MPKIVKRKIIICECGKGFEVRVTDKRKYCSVNCYNKYGKCKESKRKNLSYIDQYGFEKAKRLKVYLSLIHTGKKQSKKTVKKRIKTRQNNGKEWHSKETIEKIGKANKGKVHSEQFRSICSINAQNRHGGPKKYKRGWFIDRLGNEHYFSSSYEERRMKFLNENNILFLKKHDHTFFWFDDNNKIHAYTPDLLINNEILEEIKPECKLQDRDVILKAKAAREYCKQNKLNYRIITEKFLEKY